MLPWVPKNLIPLSKIQRNRLEALSFGRQNHISQYQEILSRQCRDAIYHQTAVMIERLSEH
jgi:hypothetical protein